MAQKSYAFTIETNVFNNSFGPQSLLNGLVHGLYAGGPFQSRVCPRSPCREQPSSTEPMWSQNKTQFNRSWEESLKVVILGWHAQGPQFNPSIANIATCSSDSLWPLTTSPSIISCLLQLAQLSWVLLRVTPRTTGHCLGIQPQRTNNYLNQRYHSLI